MATLITDKGQFEGRFAPVGIHGAGWFYPTGNENPIRANYQLGWSGKKNYSRPCDVFCEGGKCYPISSVVANDGQIKDGTYYFKGIIKPVQNEMLA